MTTDDLRRRLDEAWKPPFYPDEGSDEANEQAALGRWAHAAISGIQPLHEVILDRLEAVARAHASERIESFAAHAPFCPFCGYSEADSHAPDCPIDSGKVRP